MTQLIIARHGNTFDPGDTVLRIGARTDLSLSQSGRAQAAALAETLAERGLIPDALYSAPLQRTLQTARIVAERLALTMPIEPLAGLTEIDYGPDEGAKEADVVRRLGAEALARWDRDGIVPSGWQIDSAALQANWSQLFQALARRHPGQKVLLLTSNGVARFALDVVTDGAQTATRKLATAAFGIIDLGREGHARLVDWNLSHRPAP